MQFANSIGFWLRYTAPYAICIQHMDINAQQSVALRRAARKQWTLKPQDLAMGLKLALLRGQNLSYAALSAAMRLSPYEAHAAVQRLAAARLMVAGASGHQISRAALREFLLHGARFAYPPVIGEATIGVPTAHAAKPLSEHFETGQALPPVWPHSQGQIRGTALLPLYPRLPEAAVADSELHELLALFDALRIGQARERKMASELIAMSASYKLKFWA